MTTYDYKVAKFNLFNILRDKLSFPIVGKTTFFIDLSIRCGTHLTTLYMLYCLDNELDINLDTTLIRQCCMLITNPDKNMGRVKENFEEFEIYFSKLQKNKGVDISKIPKKNIEEEKIKYSEKCKNITNEGIKNKKRLETIREVFDKYFPQDKLIPNYTNCNDTCLTAPIELFSDAFITNIQNYTTYNYFKFQFRYLKFIVTRDFPELNKKQLVRITHYIQKCISISDDKEFNYNIKNSSIDEDLYMKLKKRIDKIINDELKNITITRPSMSSLNSNTYDYKKSFGFINILKSNTENIIKYFYKISNILTSNKEKGFNIIPQYSLDVHHINYDYRSLCTFYNKTFNQNLTIGKFEHNFVDYFNELFDLGKVGIKMKKIDFYPKLISTNGYSVSIIFAKKCTAIKKSINKPKKSKSNINTTKEDLETLGKGQPLISGLYDADNVFCTEKYLEQYNIIGYDINNKNMFVGIDEANRIYKVTKAEYNDLSNITCTTKSINEFINESGMNKIYEKLSTESKCASNIKDYQQYTNSVLDNIVPIYKFYGSPKVLKLKQNRYINKRKAISEAIRKMVPYKRKQGRAKKRNKNEIKIENKKMDWRGVMVRRRNGRPRKKKKDPFFDAEIDAKLKGKPVMIMMGKGNGNITISNVRGTTIKGPIKTIINELSKKYLVILVDEFNTSKLCWTCKNELYHSEVINDISKNKIEKEYKLQEKDPEYVTKKERIDKGRELIKKIKRDRHGSDKKRKKKKLKDLNVLYPCHSQSCCKTCKKVWQRDVSSGGNIKDVGKNKLLQKDLGNFSRSKNKNDNTIDNTTEKAPTKVSKKQSKKKYNEVEHKPKHKKPNKIVKNSENAIVKPSLDSNSKPSKKADNNKKLIESSGILATKVSSKQLSDLEYKPEKVLNIQKLTKSPIKYISNEQLSDSEHNPKKISKKQKNIKSLKNK